MKAQFYQLFLDVQGGTKTPEEAQSEILKILSIEKPPKFYSGKDLHTVPLGIYKIFWKDGGTSLASVGNLHDGVRWIAPINWTSKDSPTGRMDECASDIKKMVFLNLI